MTGTSPTPPSGGVSSAAPWSPSNKAQRRAALAVLEQQCTPPSKPAQTPRSARVPPLQLASLATPRGPASPVTAAAAAAASAASSPVAAGSDGFSMLQLGQPLTARTLARLYSMQHTVATPRGPPPPGPSEAALARAAVLQAREELLEERRTWWDRRWSALQEGLAKNLREAQELEERAKGDDAMRARAEEERATADQALQRSRQAATRERVFESRARQQECLALNVEAQRAHVFAHYCDSLLAPHRSDVWMAARQEEVRVLEETELTLRESARSTRRSEQLEHAQRVQQQQRAHVLHTQAKEQRKRETGAEARRTAKETAQARALRVRTGGRLS